ncbi:uncharacterized protein LOC109716873 [Ananas comosus]|uniref:Uncharacterized protein LOC109716873 n=1 Tax=Ananas comosus TaxID=4615 RepID=A0A199UG71_ANACO|nr:uncharacterized protein LOC109716873 [Ananas comosus]OAY63711.1 hypothetical protein ACMD2_07877 [Ananas comosus]
MGSSLRLHSPCLPTKGFVSDFAFSALQLAPYGFSNASNRRFSPRICFAGTKLESWSVPADASLIDDGFGGWFTINPELQERKVVGSWKAIFVGIGAPMAVLLAALTYFSMSTKGLKLCLTAPFHTLYEKFVPGESSRDPDKDFRNTEVEVKQDSKGNQDVKVDADNLPTAFGGCKRVYVPFSPDSAQLEALSVMKKLQIIENDVNADELCTRREFARWLVKVNSKLERKRRHKIIPNILVSSAAATAFDDVPVDDPDFWFIQSLGESGIVDSKITYVGSSYIGDSGGLGNFYFFPERYLSRLDLMRWKTFLEYSFTPGMDEKILREEVGILDLSACSDVPTQLLVDFMGGERSILRRVFGNIRLLQPHKPVTKAQAAVALISGRMAEVIRAELSRLEAENSSRLAEMEEIGAELIQRGEIQSYWDEKLKKEIDREIEAEKDLQTALDELEKEKLAQEESRASYLKERAALDCQKQLLSALREEVDGLCDKLSAERANVMAEQLNLEKLHDDMRSKQDAIIEAKSILEAEKEALYILRCWVEEEAMRNRARAEVLQQAVRRWRFSDV